MTTATPLKTTPLLAEQEEQYCLDGVLDGASLPEGIEVDDVAYTSCGPIHLMSLQQ